MKENILDIIQEQYGLIKYLEAYTLANSIRNDDIGLFSNFFLKVNKKKEVKTTFKVKKQLATPYYFIKYGSYLFLKNKSLFPLLKDIDNEIREFEKDPTKDLIFERLIKKLLFIVLIDKPSPKLKIFIQKYKKNFLKFPEGLFLLSLYNLELENKEIRAFKSKKDNLSLSVLAYVFFKQALQSKTEIDKHEKIISHYQLMSKLNKQITYNITENLTPESLLEIILIALILKKCGYSNSLYIPNKERINYLSNFTGKQYIEKTLFNKFKEAILRFEILNFKLNLIVIWLFALFLIWIGFLKIIPQIGKFSINEKYINLIMSDPIIMFAVGGIIMYFIIYHRLKRLEKKYEGE